MLAVAKKIRNLGGSSAEEIPGPIVRPNTKVWRDKVNAELDARGRGARADLVRHLKARHASFSTGQLTELLNPDEKPGQKRYSQYIDDIDEYLWPHMMPLSRDTDEVKYLLEGIAKMDKDLVRVMLEMDPDEQRALASFIAATRKPK